MPNVMAKRHVVAKRRITERSLHATIVDWLRLVLPRGVILQHAPGEGRRGWVGARDLIILGYKAGWPDIELLWSSKVAFAEIKAIDGRLTPVQIACHAELRQAGFIVEVVRSLEAMRQFLIDRGIPFNQAVHL